MTNFDVFDKRSLNTFLSPFGMPENRYMTIIKYEAMTPDMAALLFRTLDKDESEQFFVLLIYDHIPDINIARQIIGDWCGEIVSFMKPLAQRNFSSGNLDEFSVHFQSYYYGILAQVARPTGKGYWATYRTILPGDNIDDILEGYSKEEIMQVKRAMLEVITVNKHLAYQDSNFFESWRRKDRHPQLTPDKFTVNNTDFGFNVFKNGQGGWELFFNRVKD